MLLVADAKGFPASTSPGRNIFRRRTRNGSATRDHAPLNQAKRELAEYFAGKRKRFDVALEPAGTPFQRSVWKAISSVGFGKTLTYARAGAARRDSRAARALRARRPAAIRSASSCPAIASSVRTAA